jgi:hypothetical protein
VYLKAYETVSEARASIGRYLGFYNTLRPHSAHGGSDATSGAHRSPRAIGYATPSASPIARYHRAGGGSMKTQDSRHQRGTEGEQVIEVAAVLDISTLRPFAASALERLLIVRCA